jgi:hypothetical protein
MVVVGRGEGPHYPYIAFITPITRVFKRCSLRGERCESDVGLRGWLGGLLHVKQDQHVGGVLDPEGATQRVAVDCQLEVCWLSVSTYSVI